MADLKTILVVDDDKFLKETLTGILKARGYNPIPLNSGQSAVEAARMMHPVIALVDLKLEDMNGLEVIRAIKADSPQTECIALATLAGGSSQASAVEAIDLGAYSYLNKPYDIEQLLVTMRRAIERTEGVIERSITEKALTEHAKSLHKVNEELAGLYRASESLISVSAFDLQSLGQKIVETVLREFGQSNCSLTLVQPGSNELERVAVAGPFADRVKKQKLTLNGPGLLPRAIRSGQVINAADVRSASDYIPSWDAARSELAIPLKVGENIIGAIDVQSTELGAFTADDERLMTIFAERAALTLEHTRLYEQTESNLHRLAALHSVDMAIAGGFDLNIALNTLLAQLTSQLGISAANILLFNAQTQSFEYACGRGFRTRATPHRTIGVGDSLAGRALLERRMISIPDLSATRDEVNPSQLTSDEEFAAYYGIPLIAKGQIKGVLEIYHRTPLRPDPDWLSFLDTLAGQAAIAIDNTSMFEGLQRSNIELTLAYDSTLEGWAKALELRDNTTEGHSRRVTEMTLLLCSGMGMHDSELVHIRRGALLHDIGKMGIPDRVLLKNGPLNAEETHIIQQHPTFAYQMLSPIIYLRPALDIPYCHHEKWDGSGYPRGLIEETIPLAARIFSVVDVWDALRSDRPYRSAWSDEKARQYIIAQAGIHFDPEVVDHFLRYILEN